MKKWSKLPKSKRQNLVLVGILTLVALALMWVMWISNNLDLLSANKSKMSQLETQITELESKARLDAHNQPVLEQTIAFVKPLGLTMLAGDPYMWTVRELRAREEKYGVKIQGIRPGTVGPHPRRAGFNSYSAQIEVEGSYDQIGRFVQHFENDFVTSELRRMEIAPLEDGTDTRRAVFQIAFLVYPETKFGPPAGDAKESPR